MPIVTKKTGYSVEFDIKPMENILKINDKPKHEPVKLIETDYYDKYIVAL